MNKKKVTKYATKIKDIYRKDFFPIGFGHISHQ
jgi:hypothetical protein